MIPTDSVYTVLKDYFWIVNCALVVIFELDTSLYLWYKDKKSSIFTHPRNEWFLKKISIKNQKNWKYTPYWSYLILAIMAENYFDFKYYFPNIYTILIVLLVIHSIVFIKEWMREKEEEKNNNPPLTPKEEKDIKLVHK
ncbi:MAG: hypothetical protein IJU47_06805 [Verrucomicrobia bacterium]|nr:hypothetical protein [Verrucomicrobiota bacterium]